MAEIAPLVRGATLSEIVALPPRDLVAYLRQPVPEGQRATVWRLHISAEGDAPRLYLQTSRQKHPGGPIGPFFQRLTNELVGARLRRLEQVARDRIVTLEFDETPSGERRALLAELVGRHSNLVLLGPSERVLDLLVSATPSAKAAPRLVLGAPWQAPPGRARTDAGPSLREVLGSAPVEGSAAADDRAPLSYLVQEALGREVHELALQRARRTLLERIERKLKRARSLEFGLTQRLVATGEAERVRLDGEALKIHLGDVQRGQREIVLADPFSLESAERRIVLDPRRSPHENVELLFDRYKKLVRARASVERELELARAKLAELQELLERAGASEAPIELEQEAVASGLLEPPQEADARKRKAPAPRKPYRSFRGLKGSEIRVGRAAKDNDDLTFHHARGNDLWLHTADAPGSHVVLPLEKQAEPDPEEVLDAAHLAVHFSPLRDARRANVHIARRKEVHKPRGAKPGLVTLSGGKVLHVRMQPERLRRLLDDARG